MSWSAATLIALYSGEVFNCVTGPALDEGEELKGILVQTVCPRGCVHVLAYEPDLEAALELASARLAAGRMPGSYSLLLVHQIGVSSHERFTALRDEAAKYWRGVVS